MVALWNTRRVGHALAGGSGPEHLTNDLNSKGVITPTPSLRRSLFSMEWFAALHGWGLRYY